MSPSGWCRRYARQAEFIGMIRRPERRRRAARLGVTPIVGDLDVPATLKRLPRVDGVFHFAPPPNAGSTDPRTAHCCTRWDRRSPGAFGLHQHQRCVTVDCGGNLGRRNASGGPGNRPCGAAGRCRARLRAWGETQRVQVDDPARTGNLMPPSPAAGTHRRGTPALVAQDDSTPTLPCRRSGAMAWAACFVGVRNASSMRVDAHPMKMGGWFDSCADAFDLPRAARVRTCRGGKVLSAAMLSFRASRAS